MLANYKRNLKQFVFFGFVGVLTLLIDVAITTFLHTVFHLAPFMASAIGFCSGFFFNFPMNRHKVFRHSSNDRFSLNLQIIMVLLLSLFNLVFTSAVVHLLVTHEVLPIGIAKTILTGAIAVWNFLLFKFVVFSKRTEDV